MAVTEELSEIQVLKTVLYHSSFIILLPVLCFFSCKTLIFDGVLGMETVSSNVYAACVTIFVLHVALGSFIYRTYFRKQIKPQSKSD